MDVEYRGANCVVIRDKKILIVVDPTANVSVKEAKNLDAVILATQEKFAPVREDKGDDRERNRPFVIDMPGEYEHNDVSVLGLPVHAHIDKDGKSATMYRIETDGVSLAVIGHTDAPLNDDDLESLGMVDIVIVPVGGGYTLDARDAATIGELCGEALRRHAVCQRPGSGDG